MRTSSSYFEEFDEKMENLNGRGAGGSQYYYGILKAWGMMHFGYSEGKGCENVETWNLELPNVHFEQSVWSWVIIIIKKNSRLSALQLLSVFSFVFSQLLSKYSVDVGKLFV